MSAKAHLIKCLDELEACARDIEAGERPPVRQADGSWRPATDEEAQLFGMLLVPLTLALKGMAQRIPDGEIPPDQVRVLPSGPRRALPPGG